MVDVSLLPPGSPGRTLALGVTLAHGLPAGVLMAFAATAELAAPFDALPVGHPLAIAWVLLGALVAGVVVRRRLVGTARRLAAADEASALDVLRARVASCSRRLPLITLAYVVGGLALLLVLAPPLALDGTAVLALVALMLLLSAQMLAPALLLAYDAYGECFGAWLRDRPAMPGVVRGAPMVLVALVLAVLLPLADQARFGAIVAGTWVLVLGLMAYVALVIAISLRLTRHALVPVSAFLAAAEAGRADDRLLTPRALDGVGVAVARTRDLVRSLDRARNDLERSEARLKAFATASSDWFFEWDADLVQVWISERFRDAVGLDPAPFIGRPVLDELARALDPAELASVRERLARHEPIRDLILPPRAGGSKELWLRISAVPVHEDDGRFSGYLGTGADVTEQVRQETALKERDLYLAQAQRWRPWDS